jgi:hypothetical protein
MTIAPISNFAYGTSPFSMDSPSGSRYAGGVLWIYNQHYWLCRPGRWLVTMSLPNQGIWSGANFDAVHDDFGNLVILARNR